MVGCGGDRDRGKRPIMAKIATDKSDVCIFTADNPRTEDACKHSSASQNISDHVKYVYAGEVGYV